MHFLSNLQNVKIHKLGEICKLQKGVSFKAKDYQEEGAPVLKIKDIQDSKVNTNNLFYCDPESHKNANIIKYGDVVIVTSGAGSIGKVGINLTDLEFFPASDIIKFEPDENILRKRYLYHFLLSAEEQIQNLITTGIIPHLYKSSLERFQIPIPSLNIQDIISEKLDKFREIEREIEREIQLRQKQYEYYRDHLINGGA